MSSLISLHVHELSIKVDMKHRILSPFFLQFINGKTFEQLFSSFEISFEGRNEQTLTESAWTAEEVDFRLASLVDKLYANLHFFFVIYKKKKTERMVSVWFLKIMFIIAYQLCEIMETTYRRYLGEF